MKLCSSDSFSRSTSSREKNSHEGRWQVNTNVGSKLEMIYIAQVLRLQSPKLRLFWHFGHITYDMWNHRRFPQFLFVNWDVRFSTGQHFCCSATTYFLKTASKISLTTVKSQACTNTMNINNNNINNRSSASPRPSIPLSSAVS